jgi:hypothetical protein
MGFTSTGLADAFFATGAFRLAFADGAFFAVLFFALAFFAVAIAFVLVVMNDD